VLMLGMLALTGAAQSTHLFGYVMGVLTVHMFVLAAAIAGVFMHA